MAPLHAKICRPAARLIGREAAVRGIASCTSAIVWVAAPKGSGKTSLGLEFVDAHKGAVAWLRLDEADVDPASFFMYFQQAVLVGGVAAKWNVPVLQQQHLPALQGYIRLFVRSLATNIAPGARLILDDAHECQAAPFFRQFLQMLAEEMPAGVKVLVLSRASPPAGSDRLLANGLMQEINGEALVFTSAETQKLLHLSGVEQAAERCDSVFNFTLGWAAGIALAASWLKHQPRAVLQHRPDAILKYDSTLSRAVAAYLADEVFATYDPAEQETLFAVCWLPYFSSEWASELAGSAAPEAIARLAAQGALIYSYPGRQYSLHPLFQRFLCDKAALQTDAARRVDWIERGIRLLQADGNTDAAIELALKHGSASQAAALIATRANDMLAHAQHQTLARWIGMLPEDQRGAWHHYWLGMAIFSIDTAQARNELLKAHAAFADEGNDADCFLALNWIIQSYFFNSVASEPLNEFLRRHVDPERDYERLTDTSLKAILTLSVFSSLAAIDPGHPDMALWEQRGVDVLSQPVDPMLKAHLAMQLAHHYATSGRYSRITALRTVVDALPEMQTLPLHARYFMFLIPLYDDLARFAHASMDETYAKSQRCGEESGIHIMDGSYAGLYATDLLLRGDLDGVRRRIDEINAARAPGDHLLSGHMRLFQSWVANWSGDAPGALQYAHLVRETAQSMGHARFDILALVRECPALALLNAPECEGRLAELRRIGEQARYPVTAIHADLLQAWLLLRGGKISDAHVFLARGLGILARESVGFLYGGLPQILQPLCAEALRVGIEPDIARRLVRGYGLTPPPDAPQGWPWRVTIRCFGIFELHIDGEPLRSSGKSKHRQLELIKLLAAHAPVPMALVRIAELLWPDSDGDAARGALETTLSRLRTTLGGEIFRNEHGALTLDRTICWIDTAALDARLPDIEGQVAQLGVEPIGLRDSANDLLDLYRGALLPDDGASWSLLRREYWRSRVARSVGAGAQVLADRGHLEDAVQLLGRALETDPVWEPFTAALMRINLDADRHAEGLAAYQRYRRIILGTSGSRMSPELDALAKRLQSGMH